MEIRALKDQLYQENVALREEMDEKAMFEDIAGKSEALQKVLKDEEGENVLLEMLRDGAVLVAQRAYMKNVLEALKAHTYIGDR